MDCGQPESPEPLSHNLLQVLDGIRMASSAGCRDTTQLVCCCLAELQHEGRACRQAQLRAQVVRARPSCQLWRVPDTVKRCPNQLCHSAMYKSNGCDLWTGRPCVAKLSPAAQHLDKLSPAAQHLAKLSQQLRVQPPEKAGTATDLPCAACWYVLRRHLGSAR